LQVGLTAVSIIGKLAYSYDLGAWSFLEGIMNARSHPNILFWNITRFNPFYCLLEVSCCLGCLLCVLQHRQHCQWFAWHLACARILRRVRRSMHLLCSGQSIQVCRKRASPIPPAVVHA
jgi:hypothetical protein